MDDNTSLIGTDDATDRRTGGRAGRGRRSFLRGAGAAALALVAGTGVASAATAEPATALRGDAEPIGVDYDRYDQPSEVYRVWTGDEATASFVDSTRTANSSALEMAVRGGDSWGTNAMYCLPENGHGQPTEVYQRYVLSLDEGWQMAPDDVCRIAAIGFNTEAGEAGSGVRGPPRGDDGWSSVVCVTDRENPPEGCYHLGTYTYHMDDHSGSGEFEVTNAAVPVGEWVELETYVRMNTCENGTANADGVVRYWLDGELAFEREDYRWTTTPDQAVEYAGPIVRYGGGEVAPQDQAFYYDEHELLVSTN